jgi:hypothetical protein
MGQATQVGANTRSVSKKYFMKWKLEMVSKGLAPNKATTTRCLLIGRNPLNVCQQNRLYEDSNATEVAF